MAASSSGRGLFTPQGTSAIGRTSKTPVDYISPSLKRCHVVLTSPSKYQDINIHSDSRSLVHHECILLSDKTKLIYKSLVQIDNLKFGKKYHYSFTYNKLIIIWTKSFFALVIQMNECITNDDNCQLSCMNQRKLVH